MTTEKTIQEVYNDIKKFNQSLGCIINELAELQDITDLRQCDPDEAGLMRTLYKVQEKLEDAEYLIDYYSRPIKAEGKIKRKGDRYYIGEYKLTYGETVEIFVKEKCYSAWVRGEITYKDDGYSDYGLDGFEQLEGELARIR